MGAAVGVERATTLQHPSHIAQTYSQAANAIAYSGRHCVLEQHVSSCIHRVVKKHLVCSIKFLTNYTKYIESVSKSWFVAKFSTTSIAEAYTIDMKNVHRVTVSKHDCKVDNRGLWTPESTKDLGLELQDNELIDFLLSKCRWTVWQPSTMWRVKLDHIFNIIVHVALQQEGFLTGEFRVVRLRLGRRWVGAQLLSEDMTDSMKNQWLHRVDYESIDGVQTVESDVFKTVKGVWDKYVADLANPLQRTPDDFNFKESFQSYEKQEKRTSLRVRVMLDTTLKDILSDCRTTFWMPYQFELWLMEQEDAYKYQQFTVGNQHIGSIVNGSYEDLVAIYEMKDMAAEDFGVAWFLE